MIMSQRFRLQLATDDLSSAAQQLNVAVESLHLIQVRVDITLIKSSTLELTYHIQLLDSNLATLFDWAQWQQQQVKFTDYLWERTCIECFISSSSSIDGITQTTEYIEINASPNGSYALYHFDDYRQPNCLPPIPLHKANSNEQADISWTALSPKCHIFNINVPTLSQFIKMTPNSLSALTFTALHDYTRRFTVDLEQLPSSLLIRQLHPCVILYFDNVALYFAPKHASPPDFHQQGYWTDFKP